MSGAHPRMGDFIIDITDKHLGYFDRDFHLSEQLKFLSQLALAIIQQAASL